MSAPVVAEPLRSQGRRTSCFRPRGRRGAGHAVFDLTAVARGPVARATTDADGHFALSLAALGGTVRLGRRALTLGQNYPNPFNPATIIPYQLPTATHVRLEVFNVLGQHLATLVNEEQPAGFHTVRWDATNAAGQAVGAGVYFYRLRGQGVELTRRMVLIDGQAGTPAAVVPAPAAPARAPAAAEQTYGLVIAGAGVEPYVDAAFAVRPGMAPVEVVVAAVAGLPRGKALTGGVLGDVNGDGQVNSADALLLMAHVTDTSVQLPSPSLGDVNGDGQVNLADALLLTAYVANPADPSVPAGIGKAVSGSVGIGKAVSSSSDGDWVVGATRRLTTDSADDYQPAWSPDGQHIAFVYRRDGNREIYVMGSDGTNRRRLTTHSESDVVPAWSPDGQHIAFASNRDGNSEIYVMGSDGTNLRRLTNHEGGAGRPAWSPDGQHIAFHSNRDGNGDIYVMDADGTNLRRLTNHAARDRHPAWSPDGQHIAFNSERDGNWEIYVMGSDGTNLRRLTNHAADDTYPSWSPDGRHIAFESRRDGDDEIYVMGSDGTNLRRLTNHAARDRYPAWSPNGQHIAFYSYRDGNWEIYVMELTNQQVGSEFVVEATRRLTTDSAADVSPSWSPDGRHIAFNSNRDGNTEIYVMGSDGTNLRRLTNHAAHDFFPSWSLDGLAFYSKRDGDGNFDIYVMGSDGTNLRRLTNHAAHDRHPAWSPDGRQVAFYSEHDDNFDIYVIDSDGTNLRRLTTHSANDRNPAWSPDSQQIAFQSDRDGQMEIYVMAADGTNLRRLTNHGAADAVPSWSPDGRHLAFQSDRDGNREIYVMGSDGTHPRRLTTHSAADRNPAWSPDGRHIAFDSDRDGNREIYVMELREAGSDDLPDLVVDSPAVSNSTLTPGQSFTLTATVRNLGTAASASTTLRYYRSSDATISSSDSQVGTDSVPSVLASDTEWRLYSITLTAPSSEGTYYYGACVDAVSGESNAGNNCSTGVLVTVGGGGDDFDLGTENDRPEGITYANNRLYVADREEKVYVYNSSGERISSADFNLDSNPRGITYANNRFYIVDYSDDKVYVYSSSGGRVSDADFNLDGNNSSPRGITYANNRFYIVDYSDDKVYVYSSSGGRVSSADFNLDSANDDPRGITYANNHFYVADWVDEKVYVYNSSGGRVSDADFNLSSNNGNATGITYANNLFYVVDYSDDKVYVYSSTEPPTYPDLDIVDPPTVSDNPLKPGQSFTLTATVRNLGTVASASTTLRYYRSSDATISSSDSQVGTDSVPSVSASDTEWRLYSITLTAPSSEGTYYYGACVDAVSDESNTGNNCSTGVRVMVGDDGDAFVLGTGNDDPQGITYANNRFYVVDRSDDKVYVYNSSGGRVSSADFNLDGNNSTPRGITYANNRFYVVDSSDDKVYVYSSSGGRVSSADFNLDSNNGGPTGITHANSQFYVVDRLDDKVYVYSSSGGRVSSADFNLDSNNGNANGITYATNRFYLVDINDEKVYVYSSSGDRVSSADFNLDSNNGGPQGITYANNRFYVVDPSDKKVYVYSDDDGGGNPTFVSQHDDRVIVMGLPSRLTTDPIDFDALTQVFFDHYEDAFDYLMFFSNLSDIRDNQYYNYYGIHLGVQNTVQGTGKSLYSRNQAVGSAGKLNAILHFPYNEALLYGPSLHEIMHSWANYAIPSMVGGHWGFSSAHGQLGGFERTNLIDHGSGRYSAGRFGTIANGGNSLPYSPIELYFAGLIPPSEVPDLWVAEDGEWLGEDDSSGHPIFTASQVSTWSIERIVAEHGARLPDSSLSQKQFRAALILLVDQRHPALEAVLDRLSTEVQYFTYAGSDSGNHLFNFWEATGGRATLAMDGLSAYRTSGRVGKRAVSYRIVEPVANADTGCMLIDDAAQAEQWMVAPSDKGKP